MATNLTEQAIEGYQTGQAESRNPYLFSSACWYAFEAGRALWRTGRCVPVKASMGRGYSVNVDSAATRFLVWFDKHNAPVIDRKD